MNKKDSLKEGLLRNEDRETVGAGANDDDFKLQKQVDTTED